MWQHGCMMRRKHIYLIGTDPRRINDCIEGSNDCIVGSDDTRDGGEYEKGGYSISISISIGIGIGVASIVCINVAFIVCIGVNCRGMNISIHKAKHWFESFHHTRNVEYHCTVLQPRRKRMQNINRRR
jgi:hypothetical protein